MVVQRTELLIYQREVCIAVLSQLLEADAARGYILHADAQCALALIRQQVQRHVVIHALAGHAYILFHLQDTRHADLYLAFGSRLLNGQPQVAPLRLGGDDGLLAGLRCERLRQANAPRRQRERCDDCNQFLFHGFMTC